MVIYLQLFHGARFVNDLLHVILTLDKESRVISEQNSES